MVLHDFECSNHTNPVSFEFSVALADKKMPRCPRCHKRNKVKKVIKKAFPVSQSWRTS